MDITLTQALQTAEDLLEKVPVAGEDNWNRMSDGKRLIRAVRQELERQEREAMKHAGSDDAGGDRDPENDAGAV